MVERGDDLRLALETLAEPLGRDLDGDVTSQAGIPRAIHLAHAAQRQSADDLVGAEFVPATNEGLLPCTGSLPSRGLLGGRFCH